MDSFKKALQKRISEGASRVPFTVRFFTFLHKLVRATAVRSLPRELINPRYFSNMMLRRYGGKFSGDVINVSGWDDGDGEGHRYREYFPKKNSYVVSNAATEAKGIGSMKDSGIQELPLDLNAPLSADLLRRYDVVFNHTTLEHVIHFEQAFENLCALSKDAVIIVVPTLQQVHFGKGYGDYWRPTPIVIAKLFYRHGFTPLVISTNDQAFAAVYIFAIGVREPQAYENRIQPVTQFDMGGQLYGSGLKYADLPELFEDGR
jgi:hypothetical protein